MIKNLTQNIQFFCINNHKEPVLMTERERTDDNHDNFFACPRYMRKDEKHPDGFDENETGCNNRLSFSDAGDIIAAFNRVVDEDMASFVFRDYTNYEFTFKSINVVVLSYDSKVIKFGVLNKKAVRE